MLNKNLLKKTLIVTFSLGLAACSNTEGLEASVTELTNKVDSLSNQVAELQTQQQAVTEDVKAAKVAAEQAAIDAQKTNERIDNVVATYQK